MREMSELLEATTQGEWVFVNNENTVSVALKDPADPTHVWVFMEIGGRTLTEVTANARLVLVAKEGVPKMLEANAKLAAALTAACELLAVADVVVTEKSTPAWAALTQALQAMDVTPIAEATAAPLAN